MTVFIGRQEEIGALKRLFDKRSASLVVIKGRRRIGKSRLLEEFAKFFDVAYFFAGLAPTKEMAAQKQRDEFAKQYARQLETEPKQKEDWGDLFWSLSQKTQEGRVLIVLDEITWMGSLDADFLGKLKNAWDLYFKKNDQLVLALCGSVSTWIEKNILSSTGFLGRESLVLNVDEMPLIECAEFWNSNDNRISAYEKLKILSITGGVPRYLESINPKLSAEQNISQLCFDTRGILFDEFEKIFSDLFSSKSDLYKKIVTCLADGVANQETILQYIGLKKSGDISDYLNDLITCEFISRDFTWKIKDGNMSNLSYYRLKDNYSRFYLKYILPNKEKIKQGNMRETSILSLKGWYTIMGLQVENLLLSNRRLIKQKLQIDPNDVVMDNPFFQRKTTRQKGCQIDYMIQTKHNVLYICEIRFSGREIGIQVIDDVREKIGRLTLPKQFSFRPILIHINGVSESVEESQYFTQIIDFSDFV